MSWCTGLNEASTPQTSGTRLNTATSTMPMPISTLAHRLRRLTMALHQLHVTDREQDIRREHADAERDRGVEVEPREGRHVKVERQDVGGVGRPAAGDDQR